MNKSDEKIYNLCRKNAFYIVVSLLIFISIIVRMTLAPNLYWSADYKNFYQPWIDAYREKGLAECLKEGIGDYYIPFNFLYFIFSLLPCEAWVPLSIFFCAMEYISAFYIYKILRLIDSEENENRKRIATLVAVSTLYLPHVILNSALWKQCDSIYTMFTFMALYYLLKGRHTLAFGLLALGFCFKLQMIFVLPLFVIVYVCAHKFNFFQFFQIPIWYLITGIPAMLAGRRWQDVIKIYFGQMKQEAGMTINTPGFYVIGLEDYFGLYRAAIMIVIAFFIFLAYHSFVNGERLTGKRFFQLGGLCIWTCFEFLPAMHERYDYAAIILIFVYCIMFDRKLIWTSFVMIITSICTYSNALLSGSAVPLWICSLSYFAAWITFAYDYFNGIREHYKAEREISCNAKKT